MKKGWRTKGLAIILGLALMVQSWIVSGLVVLAESLVVEFEVEGHREEGLKGFREPGSISIEREINGKMSWVMESLGTDADRTIHFSLQDAEMKRLVSEGTGLEITVEYYDTGGGFFGLVYDAVFDETEEAYYDWNEIINVKKLTRPGKFAGFVNLEGSERWKTHTFYIRDALFENRLPSGADFYLTAKHDYMGNSGSEIAISKVTVTAMETKSPARIWSTSNEVGNIFFRDSEVKFETDIVSVRNYDFEGEAVFSVININDIGMMYDQTIQPMRLQRDGTLADSLILEQQRKPIKLKAGESIKETVTFNIENFGCMTYRVELIDESSGVYTVYDQGFSRVARNSNDPLNSKMGVSLHYMCAESENNAWADTGFDLMDRIGAEWMRVDLRWAYLQPDRGIVDFQAGPKNFLVRNNTKYGGKFKMLPIINLANLFTPIQPVDYANSPEKRQIYAEFAEAAVDTLSKYGVTHYEFGNEANIRNLSGEGYGELLKVAYPYVKAKHPDAIMGGPTTAEVPVQLETDFIPRFFATEGLNNIDMVTVHPYQKYFAPEDGGNLDRLEELRQLCVEYGKPDVEIWTTETGYPTFPMNERIRAVGDDEGSLGQAAWTVRSYIINLGADAMDKYFMYTMSSEEDRTLNRYGLTHGAGSAYEAHTAKPAYVAASNMCTILNEATAKGQIVVGDNEILVYRFARNQKKDLIALWSKEDVREFSLSLGCSEITAYDMYGNATTLKSEDGHYDFVLDQTVMYLEGDFTKFEQAEPRLNYDFLVKKCVVGDRYEYTVTNNTGLQLDIETEGVGGIEVLGEPQFDANNVAVVGVKLTTEENAELNLKFYNKGELYSTSGLKLEPTPACSVAFVENAPYSLDCLERWYISIDLTNNRQSETLNGSLLFDTPEDIFNDFPAIRIPDIKAGETRRITFYLPENHKKYKGELSGGLMLNNGNLEYFSIDVDFTVATYANKKPVLDGIIETDEWKTGSWLYMDKAKQVRQNDVRSGGDEWKGIGDLSGKANLMWDAENLYLAAVVTDDILTKEVQKTASGWRNDSLQLGLKCEESTGANIYTEMTVSHNTTTLDGIALYRNKSEGTQEPGVVTDFEGIIVRDPEKCTTTYEISIPWRELVTDISLIKPGVEISFSMMVNDNDGVGRNKWIELTSGLSLEKDPAMFTKIRLMK